MQGIVFMRKQTLLRISLPPNAHLYPSRFRELLAKEVARNQLPWTLLHSSDQGIPLPGMPGVRVVGGHRWLGLLADEAHTPLLYQAMGSAVQAVTQMLGANASVEVEQRELSLTPLQTPERYWIREMVLKRRSPAARNSDLEELAQRRLVSGIERMARQYGIDCPTQEQLGIVVSVRRNLGLQLSTTNGPTSEWVTLVDMEFMIHAKLGGYWFAGNLTSRGYGRIGRNLAQLAVNFDLEQNKQRRFAA
ncbi:hypothetical protein VI03_25455 [Burkholderia vietnamiensis]|nr:hypothetical protein VI03_25455 [Burkholderia vietnamiensis]